MPDKQKDLAKQLAYEQGIKEKISVAILNDKSTVDIGNNVVINLEESQEIELGKEYDLVLEEVVVGNAVKEKKSNRVNIKLNMRMIAEKTQSETRKSIETQKSIDNGTVNPNDSNALRLEVEQGLKNGNAVRMDIDREISSTENMRMFVQRAWGISSQEIYKVRDPRDSHNIKYVAKTTSASKPFQEINMPSRNEGSNPNQKIWLMEDGKLKQKTVDNIIVKGKYAIVEDVPDSVMSQTRKTYLAIRTPGEHYIAIAAGQKQGINRNTSSNSIQKDFMSRENTVYDIEDVAEAAILAEKIYGITKDGKLTTEEVEMVRRLKIDKNMDDEEVKGTISIIIELREMGYEDSEIKRVLESQSEEEIKKLAKEVDKKDLDKKDIDEDSQKLPGGGVRTRGGGNPHDQ